MQDQSSLPPLAPPTSEDGLVDWLRLIRSRRVGPATFYRLMAEHGSAAAALDALPGVAAQAGVSKYAPCSVEDARRELAHGVRIGARLIPFGDAQYPAELMTLSDAPPLLWALGRTSLLSQDKVAVVGARNASSLGLRMARNMASELGLKGMVTVSGLARGIDTAVHAASVESGTIAVMASGLDVIYPAENRKLAADIARSGLILSEQPIGMSPQARHFPTRNRIISGLSRGVVVIEAAAKSGSLLTARNALDQGREVLAVPGHPFDARAGGCNMLLRDGATLVRNADDVIEALGAPTVQDEFDAPLFAQTAVAAEADGLQMDILNRLGPSPMAEDQLIRDLNLPAGVVTPELVTLELDGRIQRQSGGLIALAS